MTLPDPSSLPLVGALLAGGASLRMGRDKALLALGDRPLFRWAAEALAALEVPCVQVGGAPLPGLGWSCLPDSRPGTGPAAGIETALRAFPGAAVVVCAVDVPFVPVPLLRHAADALRQGADAAVPFWRGRWHPLTAAYSPSLLPALDAWLEAGRRDLQGLLDSAAVAPLREDLLAGFGDPDRYLSNLNEPRQVEAARAWLEAAGQRGAEGPPPS